MTSALPTNPPGGRRPVAILAPHWESRTEEGWITRQVAGALAGVADVHVITPGRTVGDGPVDSVFRVHHLTTPRLARAAELRRDLLVQGLSESGFTAVESVSSELEGLLDRDLISPWQGAIEILSDIEPALVVIAGHNNLGAVRAVDAFDPSVRVALLALGSDSAGLTFPHFGRVFTRSQSILAITEEERQAIAKDHGGNATVCRIGAPLAANLSYLREPNMSIGWSDYLFVITSIDSGDKDDEEAELTRLLRMRFPDLVLGIAHNDAFCVWRRGRCSTGWPIERSSDLLRLMAWARVTLDLRPGKLFGRRCVESLLYGTPIVVPDGTRAREHAERGGGGLWFADPAELVWCVEAMLDGTVQSRLGHQGRSYAEEEYGSTELFIDRVVASCGL
jgi:glycosyltransferase involved in cell wall biosynthesis